MKTLRWLAAALTALLPFVAYTRPDSRMTAIPKIACGHCHIDPNGGGPQNSFGTFVWQEFQTNGADWWTNTIASTDSDGDGYSNGQELLDSSGTWQEGDAQPPGTATSPGDPDENPTNPPIPTPTPPPSDTFRVVIHSDNPTPSVITQKYCRGAFDYSPTRNFFVASRDGKIYRVDPGPATLVLDLTGKIMLPSAQEKGFCGLAFGLDNDTAYVSYSIPVAGKPNESSLLLEEYLYNASTGQMTNPKTILVVTRPPEGLYGLYEVGQGNGYFTHYSGQPVVVDEDLTSGTQTLNRRALYLATGDGGLYLGRGYNALTSPQLTGASEWHGLVPQNPKSLCGKVLRILLTDHSSSTPYEIPPDNPYTGNSWGYREEIVAIGCRNPWGFNYDAISQSLIVPESGHDVREWTNIFEKGLWRPGEALNFGWPIIEGYGPGNRVNLTPPWNGPNPLPGIGPLPAADTFGRPTSSVAPEILQMVHNDHSSYANTPTYPIGESMIGMIYCRDSSSPLNGAQVAADFTSRKVYFWQTGMTEGALALNLAGYPEANDSPAQVLSDSNDNTILVVLLSGRVLKITTNLNAARDWNRYE